MTTVDKTISDAAGWGLLKYTYLSQARLTEAVLAGLEDITELRTSLRRFRHSAWKE